MSLVNIRCGIFTGHFIRVSTFTILSMHWLDLFWFFYRLYRSIGEYDVLRGIFSSEIGTKQATWDALLAEARSDYSEAAKRYNEVKSVSSKYVANLWFFAWTKCFLGVTQRLIIAIYGFEITKCEIIIPHFFKENTE